MHKELSGALIVLALATACGGISNAPAVPGTAPGTTARDARVPGPVGPTAQRAAFMGKPGVTPDRGCPARFTYCVTLSKQKTATVYWCYSPGSYCGPSQYQYYWAEDFYTWPGNVDVNADFSGVFNPNPGDPTYDTIGEAVPLASTHGKIKYYQSLCPYKAGSGCIVAAYVGIKIK